METAFADIASQWNAEQVKAAQQAQRDAQSTVDRTAVVDDTSGRKRKKLPTPPPGWGTDDQAYRSSMIAAKSLASKR